MSDGEMLHHEIMAMRNCCRPRGSATRWWAVHNAYIEAGWDAKATARLLGDGFWQHEVYLLARKVRQTCSLVVEKPKIGNIRVDWSIVRDLLEEGATSGDLNDYFGSLYSHRDYWKLSRGRSSR